MQEQKQSGKMRKKWIIGAVLLLVVFSVFGIHIWKDYRDTLMDNQINQLKITTRILSKNIVSSIQQYEDDLDFFDGMKDSEDAKEVFQSYIEKKEVFVEDIFWEKPDGTFLGSISGKRYNDEIKIAQIGSSEDLVVGQQVVAIGNALGYRQSVTSGWISALNRTISTEDGTSSSGLIQTDAAINPGNSGGALLNMKGELIGINSAKYADSTVEGMGYAIPISRAKPILEELMNRQTREKVSSEEKGYLGVVLSNLTTEAIQMYDMPEGAFVRGVEEKSPAEKGGICKGDIIVKFDGQSVTSGDDLLAKLQYYKSGEKIEAVVARATDGEYQESTVEITLGSRSENS